MAFPLEIPLALCEIHAQTNNNKWYNQVDRWGGGRRLLIFILGGRLWRVNRWTRTWRLTMRPHRPSPCISFSLSVCVCALFFLSKEEKILFLDGSSRTELPDSCCNPNNNSWGSSSAPWKKSSRNCFRFPKRYLFLPVYRVRFHRVYTHAQITTIRSFRSGSIKSEKKKRPSSKRSDVTLSILNISTYT